MPAKVTTQAFPGTFPDGAAMSALLQNAVIMEKERFANNPKRR
jgi:hypothetical protein